MPRQADVKKALFRSRRRRGGSILVLLVVALMLFVGVFAYFAGSQTLHARRMGAEYGHLQALYAAESGVYASFAAGASVGVTPLYAENGNQVSYQGTLESPTLPTWVTGQGVADLENGHFTATVRGYAVGGRILLWDFGT